ncbi:Txe/YoeB family addiction module toxin [Pediococcus parvulus]|uniref:Txe/YoeB family addiction module toxin n=1 Tax=Pediococcus parvulus TaxID=54062 RepID=UPI00345ED672
MIKSWYGDAWNDYVKWQTEDNKALKKINSLIKDIERHGSKGLGKSEILKSNYSGWYSKKLDKKNRLVYKIKDNILYIAECKNHYNG